MTWESIKVVSCPECDHVYYGENASRVLLVHQKVQQDLLVHRVAETTSDRKGKEKQPAKKGRLSVKSAIQLASEEMTFQNPVPYPSSTPDSNSYTPDGMETSTGNCELSLGVLSLDDVVQISSITRDEGNPPPVPVPSSSVICEGDLISSPSVSSLHESPFGRSSDQPELLKFSGSSMGSLPSPVSKLLQKKFLEAL